MAKDGRGYAIILAVSLETVGPQRKQRRGDRFTEGDVTSGEAGCELGGLSCGWGQG
jgi:hypothetical protein